MAEIVYKLSADEKALVDAGRKAQKAFDDIASGAEKAGRKSKQSAKETKEGFDGIGKSVGDIAGGLAGVLSIQTAITFGVNEMKTAYKAIEESVDRLNRKNETLASATMGQIGPDGRLMQTILREGINKATQTGPIGAEEMSSLIAAVYKGNNELGPSALDYMEPLKGLKGTVDLKALAPALGQMSELFSELSPQDITDLALLAGQNMGDFAKIGEWMSTVRQLKAVGVSSEKSAELATRAGASDQGKRAVQSVIGALLPSQQETEYAAAMGREPLKGDARLSAILANPQQYLGDSAPKLMAALADTQVNAPDVYRQAITKDIIGATAAAAARDATIGTGRDISQSKTKQEAATSSVETQAQVMEAVIQRAKTAKVEEGYAPSSFPVWFTGLLKELQFYAGGAESDILSVQKKQDVEQFNPFNAAGITREEWREAINRNSAAIEEMNAIMKQNAGQSPFGGSKKTILPPQ